jgi:hypothetical protein
MHWIDLRKELKALFDGDERTISQARWIVLRMFRIGQYSKYWNPEKQEAIGGPKWKYDDFIVRSIVGPGSSLSGRASVKQSLDFDILSGEDMVTTFIYAIQYSSSFPRNPMPGDIIYEIDKYASIEKPKPPLKALERYRVEIPVRVSGDYGRTEAYLLICRRKEGEW